MQVRDIMSQDLQFCHPEADLQQIAKMMAEQDIGAVPIVDNDQHPVGMVTDRDITVRVIAKRQDPYRLHAADVMTERVITARPDMDVHECVRLMEREQIRRIPVVDDQGRCCGMIAQADIAEYTPDEEIGEMVKDISQPGGKHTH